MRHETALPTITAFLEKIGITIEFAPIERKTFLHGILIQGQRLVIDRAKLRQPGDLMHEAGHIATIPSLFRPLIDDNVETSLAPHIDAYMASHSFPIDTPEGPKEDPVIRGCLQSSDPEATAWSYAAAIEAGIDPAIVFHPDSFDGEADDQRLMLEVNSHYGIHGLSHAGMCDRRAWPRMNRWLQL